MNTGQLEACLSNHGQVGGGVGKLGQPGASWGKFELAQCSHCFLSPMCFVHYLWQHEKWIFFIVDSGKNRSLFKKRAGLRLTCAQKGQWLNLRTTWDFNEDLVNFKILPLLLMHEPNWPRSHQCFTQNTIILSSLHNELMGKSLHSIQCHFFA